MKPRITTHTAATLLLVWLFGILQNTQAQTVWNKTYIADRPTMIFGSVISIDTSYIFTGGTYGAVANLPKGMLGNIGLDGSLKNYKIIIDSNAQSYSFFSNALIKNNSGNLVFTGKSQDSVSYLCFGIAGKTLDSISIFRYYTPNTTTYNGYDLIQYGGNYFVTGIMIDSVGYNSKVFLVKIDSLGNRLWEKYFDQYYLDYGASITSLNNGNLLLGCVRNDLNQTHEHANTWLIEVDTAGNTIRQWLDPNDSTYAAEGLLQTQDGGFIYGAQKKFEQTVNSVSKIATLVKMDGNFNKEWTYTAGVRGDFTGFTDFEPVGDTTYIACGNYSNGQAWVIKFTDSGNIIWEKKYKGLTDVTSTWNILTDIDVLPDGGLIAVGQCQRVVNPNSLPPQVGWFLKLDSNGCELESCLLDINTPPAFDANSNLLSIYPNPAQTDVELAFNNLPSNSHLYVCNVLGSLVETMPVNQPTGKLTLNTGAYPNGIYLARVEAEGRVVATGKFVVVR